MNSDMAYNWNGEINPQRKQQLLMQMSLTVCVFAFILVIGGLAYFLTETNLLDRVGQLSASTWELRH